MTPPRSLAVRALTAMLVAIAPTAVGAAAFASEAPDPPGSLVTWTVVPADANGPDGRRVVDLELAPGESATEHIAVTNLSDEAVEFALSANDGFLTSGGNFDMLPSATPPSDGGTWISVPPAVLVAADETVVVPVDVTAPEEALPGDHPAGVAASIVSGTEVAFEARVGVRFNLRAPGAVVASLRTEIIDAGYEPSPNPFAPGAVVVRYAVVNDGVLGLDVSARARADGWPGGARSESPADPEEVLPGGRIERVVRLTGVWAVGAVQVVVDASGAVRPNAPEGASAAEPSFATQTVVAVPWAQLATLLTAALLVVAFVVVRRRRRAALERMLEQARREGADRARREAGAQTGAATSAQASPAPGGRVPAERGA
ncbi:DUF916 domain-containing protein [Agromyces intestinalis]|uniref:DUF916 domain-containing protein n=1 Tax=Agromyces intestinalis TaxID=2592652 RepID=A0A5C1YF91_9MICO|nr:DUF916 domain-containing protein [Agromyces intestinalis]QEO14205.1 DUF916 domain-containing protein [Agromyces intestinalis]